MTARIRAVIPGARGAIAAALITGKRGGIDEGDRAAFRDSGLAHVLSISGLHLALAGGFFFWLVRALLALFPAIALHLSDQEMGGGGRAARRRRLSSHQRLRRAGGALLHHAVR